LIIISDCQLLFYIYVEKPKRVNEATEGFTMVANEFVLLVGKAFLHELSHGNRDQAIAFGRALLVLIEKNNSYCNGTEISESESANLIA